MPLITSSIPNFIGGVSQQPSAVRAANEAQEIENAVPSPVEGLMKRPPTEHLFAFASSAGTLRTTSTSQPPFIHMIERDEAERYFLCIQQDGTADVYDTVGNRKTLHVHDSTSFGTATAAQRKALTLGDVTFIANATTTILAGASTVTAIPSNYNRACLLWVRQANYNRSHIVKLTSGATTQTFTHVTRDVIVEKGGSGGTTGTYGTNTSPIQLTYVSGTKATSYPKAVVKVAGGSVIDVLIVEDGVGWESTIDTLLSANHASIGSVSQFEVRIRNTTSGEIGTAHVAESLFNGTSSGYIGPINGIDGTSPYTASTYADGVIYVQSSADFTFAVDDDFAGEGITAIRDEVERLEDLPPSAPHNYTVKVLGTPESEIDDYYVRFEADDAVFSRGVWVECAAPGVKYQWQNNTLPVLLIRQSDGTFMLKKADGVTPSTGQGRPSADSATVYNGYKWSERVVGNDDTNPYPTFTGLKVQDMVFHQNRLGIMSGENIIFSETSEFFNFFRTTTLDILDTDPIDVASSSPRIGKIMTAIPFNRDLILFTPNSQMVLRGGDILSPKSIAIIPAADFENQSSTIKPFPSANSIFFTFANGGYVGMRELIPQPSLDGAYLANDLTNSVSRYIPGSPSHLTATTHDNIAFIVSQGNLYGYRYFNSNNERLQSAWFKFTFADSLSGATSFAKAVWAGFIESDLYIVFLRTATNSTTGYITMEKVRMGAGINDVAVSGKDWVTNLDQRKYYASGQGTYDANTGRTTFTLAAPLSYGNVQVVTVDGYVLSVVAGTNYSAGTAGTVVVAGNWSAKAVWIGVPYTMTYQFSTPYLKSGKNVSVLSGRYQLRYLTLQYANTGYFRVTASITNGDTYTYPFTGEIIGVATIGSSNITSGTFRVPVHSKNENVTVKILNDSHLPSKILSGELEAYYNDRAQRYNA